MIIIFPKQIFHMGKVLSTDISVQCIHNKRIVIWTSIFNDSSFILFSYIWYEFEHGKVYNFIYRLICFFGISWFFTNLYLLIWKKYSFIALIKFFCKSWWLKLKKWYLPSIVRKKAVIAKILFWGYWSDPTFRGTLTVGAQV